MIRNRFVLEQQDVDCKIVDTLLKKDTKQDGGSLIYWPIYIIRVV